jgi:hypothetical protein
MTVIMMANKRYQPSRSAAKKQAPVATKKVPPRAALPAAVKKRAADAKLAYFVSVY